MADLIDFEKHRHQRSHQLKVRKAEELRSAFRAARSRAGSPSGSKSSPAARSRKSPNKPSRT